MPNGGVRRRILGDSDGPAVRGLALLFGFLFCGFSENGWYYVYWNMKVWVRCVGAGGGTETHLDIRRRSKPTQRNSPSSHQELPEHSPDPPISFNYQSVDGYPAIPSITVGRRRFDSSNCPLGRGPETALADNCG